MSDAHEPYELSPEDVGQMLGVHADTVKRWVKAGKLPGVKLPGGWWRFRRSEVTAYIDSLRVDPTTEGAA